MSERATIDAPGAPAAIGACSHAVRHRDVLYCSIGTDAAAVEGVPPLRRHSAQ